LYKDDLNNKSVKTQYVTHHNMGNIRDKSFNSNNNDANLLNTEENFISLPSIGYESSIPLKIDTD